MVTKILAVFSVVSIVAVVAYVIGRFNGYMAGMSEEVPISKSISEKYRKQRDEIL